MDPSISRPSCTIITPSQSNLYLSATHIDNLLRRKGYTTTWFASSFQLETKMFPYLQRWVEEASLVLVDITQNDPFVMYYLGMAHANRKPVLLVKEMGTTDLIPTFLLGYFIYYYQVTDPADFLKFLDLWISNQRLQATNERRTY
jgi:hypothetical protein